MKDVYILAVESLCDETSMAIVKNGNKVIVCTILTQMDTHALYGGVAGGVSASKDLRNKLEIQRKKCKPISTKIYILYRQCSYDWSSCIPTI